MDMTLSASEVARTPPALWWSPEIHTRGLSLSWLRHAIGHCAPIIAVVTKVNRKPILEPWERLAFAFGSNYGKRSRHKFTSRFQSAVKRALIYYPEARISVEKEGLVIAPSPLHVDAKERNVIGS